MYKLKPLFFLPVILFVFAVNSGDKAQVQTFGDKITGKDAVSLTKVIENFKDYDSKKVVLKGEVKKVCQMKGCWLTLVNPKYDVRVMFKDYGFTVPKDIKGRIVRLEGEMTQKLIKPKDQKHFLKDEGASKEKINAVREAKKVYRFTASGVELI